MRPLLLALELGMHSPEISRPASNPSSRSKKEQTSKTMARRKSVLNGEKANVTKEILIVGTVKLGQEETVSLREKADIPKKSGSIHLSVLN